MRYRDIRVSGHGEREREACELPANDVRGDRCLATSFRCAFVGICYVIRSQRNARIHLGISLGVIALGLWLGIDVTRWAIIVLTIGVVLMSEMMNTAVEAITDLTTDEYHPLARIAKDAAAGAVLIVAFVAVVVGILVLGPPLLARVTSLL